MTPRASSATRRSSPTPTVPEPIPYPHGTRTPPTGRGPTRRAQRRARREESPHSSHKNTTPGPKSLDSTLTARRATRVPREGEPKLSGLSSAPRRSRSRRLPSPATRPSPPAASPSSRRPRRPATWGAGPAGRLCCVRGAAGRGRAAVLGRGGRGKSRVSPAEKARAKPRTPPGHTSSFGGHGSCRGRTG